MTKTIMKGADGVKAHVGQHLGYSDYLTVTQEMVNTFADATGDHQWIHVDVEKAKKGPFGAPIATGISRCRSGRPCYRRSTESKAR